MKNVKTLLIFMIISTCAFASSQRVSSLGGNVGYWADDDNSWTSFPHTINNSNLAQISGLGGDSHKAIVRWGDGTKWGFTWDEADKDKMVNLQWGNGTYGATFGLGMTADDNGIDTDGKAMSSMDLAGSFGMVQDFGELGVGFSNSSKDWGDDATNQPAAMGLWVNLRRAQSVWLFDQMLMRFSYSSDNDDGDGETNAALADAETTMGLWTSLFTHLNIAENTTALVAMGFGYKSVANDGTVKDATNTQITFPTWTFAVESGMTDWATCRVGVTAGYTLSSTENDGGTDSKDVTSRGGTSADFSVGLGFNYGSFNLDVDVTEDIFSNPVQHVVGFEPLNGTNSTGQAASAQATLTYVW